MVPGRRGVYGRTWVCGVAIALSAAMMVSLMESAAATPTGPTPERSTALDPRDLPLLPGEPAAPEPVAAADPNADFTPLSRSVGFDPDRSQPVARSMFVTEYANPDGTRTAKQTTEPQNVRNRTGAWHPVEGMPSARHGGLAAQLPAPGVALAASLSDSWAAASVPSFPSYSQDDQLMC